MRNGSHSLGEFPLNFVRIDCPRGNRAESYRLDGLLARFGANTHAVLLLDRAGWHTTSHLDVNKNITPIFLPSRAPS